MNLSNIMKIKDQAARNLIWLQQMEIKYLKDEITELKKNQPMATHYGFYMKGGEQTLETAFKKVT